MTILSDLVQLREIAFLSPKKPLQNNLFYWTAGKLTACEILISVGSLGAQL
jgi:hypothetical protein